MLKKLVKTFSIISSYLDVYKRQIQQPVSVIVDSSTLQFQFYRRGVFNGNCGTKGSHAMLLIGYGRID